MSEYELIQERYISGRGLLKVPSDINKIRAYVLYATVFREPSSKYANFNYNPERSRYGTLVFLRKGYVVKTEPLEFKKQAFDGVNDISGQTLLAVKCAYDGVLESIYLLSVNLAGTPGGIGLAPVNYTNLIADYLNLQLSWDECRLKCYADTAIQLSLFALQYDVCNADFNADIDPPIPEPIPTIPPGQPIEGIDPPYDGENDGGSTIPFPGDSPPSLIRECQVKYDYQDLYTPANSGIDRLSAVFTAAIPVTIGTVTYSNNGNLPSNTPRKSVVQVTGSDSVSQNIQLVNNSFNGHAVSNLSIVYP